jgi:RHS repeat-associated protein
MTQENWTYTYYVRDAQGNVMATYKRSLTADIATQLATDKLVLEENHIYGSARLGVDDRESENISAVNTFAWGGGYDGNGELDPAAPATQAKMAGVNVLTPKRKLGLKLYELSNHLGNVLVTVSDRKLGKQLGATAAVEYYMADVRSTSDYSAFGAPLAGRLFSANSYRYGYQGSEKDTDNEGVYTTYYRILDVRIGKWLSVDPKYTEFESPYVSMANNPIAYNDVEGDKIKGIRGKIAFHVYKIAIKRQMIKIGKLQEQAAKAGNQNLVNAYTSLFAELSKMDQNLQRVKDSDIKYRIKKGMPEELGAYGDRTQMTVFDTKKNEVAIFYKKGYLRNALTGGFEMGTRFEDGKASFEGKGGRYAISLDHTGLVNDMNDAIAVLDAEEFWNINIDPTQILQSIKNRDETVNRLAGSKLPQNVDLDLDSNLPDDDNKPFHVTNENNTTVPQDKTIRQVLNGLIRQLNDSGTNNYYYMDGRIQFDDHYGANRVKNAINNANKKNTQSTPSTPQ